MLFGVELLPPHTVVNRANFLGESGMTSPLRNVLQREPANEQKSLSGGTDRLCVNWHVCCEARMTECYSRSPSFTPASTGSA